MNQQPMKDKLNFLKSSKQEQLKYLTGRLKTYVEDEDYETASKLKDLIIEYQSKSFSLDNVYDLKNYMIMLKIVF